MNEHKPDIGQAAGQILKLILFLAFIVPVLMFLHSCAMTITGG